VRALKALVIIMGVMIVAAVIVIVVTIINRTQDMAQRAKPYEVEIDVPAGEVVGMAADGDQVILRYRLPDGRERLVIVDASRGRIRGAIDLVQP
jgi:hypothetical protein